jgi:Phosphoadenosine phosphosulfate reductase family
MLSRSVSEREVVAPHALMAVATVGTGSADRQGRRLYCRRSSSTSPTNIFEGGAPIGMVRLSDREGCSLTVIAERPVPAAAQIKHLKRLEAGSIGIMREVMAEFRNPVMHYSIGNNSTIVVHLAHKAFFPAKPPFSLLHIDTGWKSREMIAFRVQPSAGWGSIRWCMPMRRVGLSGSARSPPVRQCAFFRCRTGPSTMSGNTSQQRKSMSCRSISPRCCRCSDAVAFGSWSTTSVCR